MIINNTQYTLISQVGDTYLVKGIRGGVKTFDKKVVTVLTRGGRVKEERFVENKSMSEFLRKTS